MKLALLYVICVMAVALVAPPAAAEGDPVQGEKLALEHCARCHDVAAGGAFKQYPPSFSSIAVYRSRDQIFARIVFPFLHAGMPEFAAYTLGADSVEDLTAYIVSLEK